MKLAVGCDHAGFPLKATVIATLRELGHAVEDLGAHSTEAVDYPDYARAIAVAVVSGRCERGIVICGSGVGASVAASKVPRGASSGVAAKPAGGCSRNGLLACVSARIGSLP